MVVKYLNISFENYRLDPIATVELYIHDKPDDEQRKIELQFWWDMLNKENAIRDFSNQDVLMARLAISLLSIGEEVASELGDHISWFFEILEFMEFDLELVINMMENHFEFKE